MIRQLVPLLVLVAMMSGSTALADEAGLAELEAARALWSAAQTESYEYSYQKHCDCYRDEPPTTVVTVTDGEIERVYHLHDDSAREVPAREGSLSLYWTIEDLFDKLASAYERDAIVRVEYEQALGYPTSLFIDYDEGFVGDETDLRLSGLTPR